MASVDAKDIMPAPPAEGYEYASDEQERLLNAVMDSIEMVVHGSQRDTIVDMIDAGPELWKSVPIATKLIVDMAALKVDEQQLSDKDMFFSQNGVIQQTYEMVWEIADAVGHPAANDEEQFQAGYFHTLKLIGEDMLMDTESAKEAQHFLIDEEYGAGTVDAAASELEAQGILQGAM